MKLNERFWNKVNKTPTCWLWTAGKNGVGYGAFYLDGKVRLAHRLAYEFIVGTIPEGQQIDHLCRVPNCVNPNHLEAVTQQENIRRGRGGAHWREKTHCPQGHPYDHENTHVWNGGRYCRKCHLVASRKFKAKEKVKRFNVES